eukprot:6833560-Prymnesium_polylepis.1
MCKSRARGASKTIIAHCCAPTNVCAELLPRTGRIHGICQQRARFTIRTEALRISGYKRYLGQGRVQPHNRCAIRSLLAHADWGRWRAWFLIWGGRKDVAPEERGRQDEPRRSTETIFGEAGVVEAPAGATTALPLRSSFRVVSIRSQQLQSIAGSSCLLCAAVACRRWHARASWVQRR